MPRPTRSSVPAPIALEREDRWVELTAEDLGLHAVTLHNRLRQDDIDKGKQCYIPG